MRVQQLMLSGCKDTAFIWISEDFWQKTWKFRKEFVFLQRERWNPSSAEFIIRLSIIWGFAIPTAFLDKPSGKAERQMLILHPVEFQIRLNNAPSSAEFIIRLSIIWGFIIPTALQMLILHPVEFQIRLNNGFITPPPSSVEFQIRLNNALYLLLSIQAIVVHS